MDYNAPSFSTDPDADYVGKSGSTIGSAIPPNVPTLTQREIVNAEKCAGFTPSNGDRTQLAQSIGRGLWIGTLGANANVLVGSLGAGVSPTKSGILQTLNPWTKLRGIALQTNTSVDVTLTVSGIGSAGGVVTAPLRKRDGTTKPAVGDVPTLRPFEVQWDGTYFCFVGSVASDGAAIGYALIEKQRATNVAAQTLANNTRLTWLLNTLLASTITGLSLDPSTGYITLPAGTYQARFSGYAYGCGAHCSRLYNRTAAADIGFGMTADSYVDGSNDTTVPSAGECRFTLSAQSVLSLDHINSANSGGSSSYSSLGDDNAGATSQPLHDAFVAIIKEI